VVIVPEISVPLIVPGAKSNSSTYAIFDPFSVFTTISANVIPERARLRFDTELTRIFAAVIAPSAILGVVTAPLAK
jgi:hypothetical protein